ncbi:hypothetical protein C8R47DRAFT_936825, partial [Mycena vitilis]
MAETPSTGDVRPPSPSSAGPVAKKPRFGPRDQSNASLKAPRQTKSQKRRAQWAALPEACSSDDVLWQEIKEILGEEYVTTALEEGTDRKSPFEYHQELEMQVVALSSSG